MDIHDLIQGDDQVASLPAVFYQLQEAIDEPDSTFDEIGDLISHDPGLTTRLLRIVNSAFYGFSTPIETISHAIGIVGMDQLHELVLSTIVLDQFKGIPENLMNMESFWQHSFACGLTARILAINRGESNAERFFVAGLLHDIGRLVICRRAPEIAREIFHLSKSRDQCLYSTEKEMLGYDHADIGGALLRAWELPFSHVEAVTFHHKPTEAIRFPLEAAIVHVADIVANTLQLGCCGENLTIPSLDVDAWERIELPGNTLLSSIMNEVNDQFEKTAHIFLQPA